MQIWPVGWQSDPFWQVPQVRSDKHLWILPPQWHVPQLRVSPGVQPATAQLPEALQPPWLQVAVAVPV